MRGLSLWHGICIQNELRAARVSPFEKENWMRAGYSLPLVMRYKGFYILALTGELGLLIAPGIGWWESDVTGAIAATITWWASGRVMSWVLQLPALLLAAAEKHNRK
jgi:hypothetical protein